MSDFDKPTVISGAAMTEATPRILGMRDVFFERLFERFKENDKLFFITADNGAPTLDRFAEQLPKQYAQVGIAEQQAVGMAAGLALEGHRVFAYAIAPFVTTRVHEQFKIDLVAHRANVCLVGVGAGYAYDIMGPTHHTIEDLSIMRVYDGVTIWSPADPATARALADLTVSTDGPQYIRFDRVGLPDLKGWHEAGAGWRRWRAQIQDRVVEPEITIVATGVMAHEALKVRARLQQQDVSCAVIDVYRPWPFDNDLAALLTDYSRVVTLEEHTLHGGLGSIVSEELHDRRAKTELLRIGVPGKITYDYGGREVIWRKYGLDADTVTARILERLR